MLLILILHTLHLYYGSVRSHEVGSFKEGLLLEANFMTHILRIVTKWELHDILVFFGYMQTLSHKDMEI